jgi:sugar transferase (PEP-CTERM system associated)
MFPVFRHRAGTAMLSEVGLDLGLAFVAVLFAGVLLEPIPGIASWLTPLQPLFLVLAAAFAACMVLLHSGLGMYRGHDLAASDTLLRVLVAAGLGGYLSYLMFKLADYVEHPRVLVGYALAIYLGCALLVRGLMQLRQEVKGPPRVLIVGTGPDAEGLADAMRLAPRTERVVAGFYPVSTETLGDGASPLFAMGAPLPDLVRHYRIDEIVVAVRDHRRGGVPLDDLLLCRSMGVRVHDMPGFYEMTHAEVPLESLKASWLIYGPGFVQGRIRRTLKRIFDVLISSLLLLVTAPIMFVAAVAIRLDSRGPVIYRQERVGLHGRSFTCLKFRSMVVDAERDGVARWASRNDSRVTRVGRFIRDTRIDELPQLFSVLKGDMSMVGPRPERPSFVSTLREQIPFYDLRHTVKPGLTGWAQVRYTYGDSIDAARRKHQFDLYYVKNNSLLLDLMVLVETISVVLFREGQ